MAEFEYKKYKTFIDEENIKNGQLASQRDINRSVNILKKEVNDLYNRAQIIRGVEGFAWESFVKYVPGEIIWYNGHAYRAEVENYNQIPYESSPYWHYIARSEYTLDLDADNYLHMYVENVNSAYSPTLPLHPATKKYVDDKIIDFNINGNFLAKNNTTPYEPSGDYNPSTKIYVDGKIGMLRDSSSEPVYHSVNALQLNNRDSSGYVQAHIVTTNVYPGFGVANNTDAWIRTTTAGILPKDQTKVSSLGTVGWEFKECHAIDFYGNSSTAKYADLAEKYLPDTIYEVGTILGIGGKNEVTLFNGNIPLAGIVSKNPAYKMNSELENGVYIALKGRVPCKIIGSAKKGQYINAVSGGCGVASTVRNEFTVGVCLKDGENLVEVKV